MRPFLITAVLLSSCASAFAQSSGDVIARPALRSDVSVTSDVVRIGDIIDNAGSVAQIAIYRAPDPGTTGSLPTAQLLAKLRVHQVIGVDTRNIQEVSVTRLARTLTSKEIELQIARALERRNGFGDASNLTITFDRDLRPLQLDPANTGDLRPTVTRFDSRSGRFDVLLEIAGTNGASPTRLRFTGTAIETVETAVLARGVERNEILKASDVVIERRPKAEVGNDGARRDHVIGMQARKALRSGQALRQADLAKPDLVQRDQMVTLIYETNGLHLTTRAKAIESGSEGDLVSVLNLQSKRTVQGIVTGQNQISIINTTSRVLTTAALIPDSTSREPRKAE